MAAAFCLPACKSDSSGWAAAGASKVVAIGDWNDVHAAVLVAVDRNEAALLSWDATDKVQTFKLRTVTDQSGTLVARRDNATDPDAGPGPIHLSCWVGLFGDGPLERSLLAATRNRLEALAGVDFRPR